MSDTSEGEPISSLDQPILFDPTPILNEVDRFYESALASDNPAIILMNRAKEMIVRFRAGGLALSKLLYRMKCDWRRFGIKEKFEDIVFAYTGLNAVTVDRYVTVWMMYDKQLVPSDVQPYLLALPMRSQIPIAKALEQGHKFDESAWRQLVEAPDNVSIRDVIRTIKQQPMRKSGIIFMLHRNGDLTAKDSDDKVHYVGWLDIEAAEKDEIVAKCITRLIDNSYIMRE